MNYITHLEGISVIFVNESFFQGNGTRFIVGIVQTTPGSSLHGSVFVPLKIIYSFFIMVAV
jgi:hypothetical protein